MIVSSRRRSTLDAQARFSGVRSSISAKTTWQPSSKPLMIDTEQHQNPSDPKTPKLD